MATVPHPASDDKQRVDPDEIRRALDLLVGTEDHVQLQVFPSSAWTNLEATDRKGQLQWLEQNTPGAVSAHWSLNPIKKLNRPCKSADATGRRWFLVDCDPVRPADSNSTEAELQAARETAEAIHDDLCDLGWPFPVVLCSGNGHHLLWRIDLPNDVQAQATCRAALQVLAGRYDSPAVKIDRTVHNATRLAKVPGTWARKGPHSEERPHRMARLLRVPPALEPVSLEQLEALAAYARPTKSNCRSPFNGTVASADGSGYAKSALQKETDKVRCATPGTRNTALYEAALKLGGFIPTNLLGEQEVIAALEQAGRDAGLSDRETAATVRSGLENGKQNPRTAPDRRPWQSVTPPDQPAGPPPATLSAQDLLALDLPEPKFIVPGLLTEGLAVLAGPPKLGKSWFALDVALAVAAGSQALGFVEVEPGDVLYLALEDSNRRVQDRLRKMLGAERPPPRLHVSTTWPRHHQGGLQHLEKWLDDHDEARLVVIDTWARAKRPSGGKGNVYEQDYETAAEVQRLAIAHGICLLVLHHNRKGGALDPVEAVSGSMGLTGAADCVLVMSRVRGKKDATLFVSGRDVEEAELGACWDALTGRWRVVGSADEVRASAARQGVLNALRKIGRPANPTEVAEALGHKVNAVKKLMWAMAGDGVLSNNNGLYQVAEPILPFTTKRERGEENG